MSVAETRKPRLHPRNAVVCCVFLLLSIALFWPAWTHPRTVAVGLPWDPAILTWFLGWQRHALTHGVNPLFSNFMNYPAGLNSMWNTSLLLPGTILAPITALLGPVFTYNLFATLGIGLSGYVAFLAIRRFVPEPWSAAVVGGFLYGFSPYMLAEGAGRIHITFALFPPLVVILLDDILIRQRSSVSKAGAFLGLATGLQFLISSEIVVATGLATVIALVVLASIKPAEIVLHIRRSAKAFFIAAIVFLVITAGPLAYQFLGPQAPRGAIHATNTYVSDLDGFLVPTSQMQLSTARTTQLSNRFTGNIGEQGSYIGVPLLLVVLYIAFRNRRSVAVRFVVLSTVIIAILSLGPRLHIGGRITSIPLPWAALQAVPGPLFRNLLPIRLMLFVFLGCAFLLAIFVREWTSASKWSRRLPAAVLTGLVFASFVPQLPYPSMSASVPAFFTSSEVSRIPQGSVALVAPITDAQRAGLLWQVRADYRYRMTGGWFVGPNAPRSTPSATLLTTMQAIERNEATPPSDHAVLLRGLHDLGVRTVIVGPTTTNANRSALLDFLTSLLGARPEHIGGVDVWFSVDQDR